MRKLLGWSLAVVLIITLLFFVSLIVGVLKALGIFALSIFITFLINLSIKLISEPTNTTKQ